MKVRDFFPRDKTEHRVEKVIVYSGGRNHPDQLRSEIVQYVATQSIESQMHTLLSRLQDGMDAGEESEVGVWVSGFYGSGKSSFTKYLGLALDREVQLDGLPFLRHLQDRLQTPQCKALLNAVAQRFPVAVVMLDLASEMLAGATMKEVSTVLYCKVLQWAGYSENLKLASLEQRLEREDRYDTFKARAAVLLGGMAWEAVHNDPLVVDEIVPTLAHEFYPEFYKTLTSFTSNTEDIFRFEDKRVEEMLDVVRRKSGKPNVLFILDEVGQYVASRQELILNLQGLAQNLKRLGRGKAWLIATAQQTLTEDDKKAQVNSGELYKLAARFPLQVDLESSDIKEICYRRLLEKSSEGKEALGRLFDTHGQALRHATRLIDAKYYDANFDREWFIKLYPFLPAHFDILLHLLGALAKSTGGIGLRSAIKVVEDILVEKDVHGVAGLDHDEGWLATTVTLFNSLEKDIKRAFPSIHHAVTQRAFVRFPDSELHKDVARSIAVLQIVGNLPASVDNIASLTHPAVQSPSRLEAVRAAVEDMLRDPQVPLGEKDGGLCFISEKLQGIEDERRQLPVRSMDARRVFSEALKAVFSPLPSARLHNTLTVSSGLKLQSNGQLSNVAGEREPVQTVVEFVDPSAYETERTRLLETSRQKVNAATVYLLARTSPESQELVEDICRGQRIVELHRATQDSDVKEYCGEQDKRAARLVAELERHLKGSMAQGSFVFQAQGTAVATLDTDVLEAAKKHLGPVATQVYHRYSEAPVRVETDLAEKLLKLGNLTAATTRVDPLGLVVLAGGKASINIDAKPLLSIRDELDRRGSMDGRTLLDHFGAAPFGWSPDTVRYLLATLLLGSQVKLKVSGKDVTVNGPQAVEALKTNRSVGPVGVSLRGNQPPPGMLVLAADRLTDLSGEMVLPLEDEISKAAVRVFPQLQTTYASLGEKLRGLGLPGASLVESLHHELADVLSSDGSDATLRLGAEESTLHHALVWAGTTRRALANGLEDTVCALKHHVKEIASLPGSGIPGRLREDVQEEVALVHQRLCTDDFHQHGPELQTLLTRLETRVRDAAIEMTAHQKARIQECGEDLERLADWKELTVEEQGNALDTLERLVIHPATDLSGLRHLVAGEFDLQSRLSELKTSIRATGEERRIIAAREARASEEPIRPEQDRQPEVPRGLVETLEVDEMLTTSDEVHHLFDLVRVLKEKAAHCSKIAVTVKVRK